ncbi:MAG TPA: response regulator [Roseiarcus sp.]|nr:response regulator [Roseiarcus sp.]
MSEAALRDRRILLVEDEFLLAQNLSDEFQAIGASVLGPAASLERALALIEQERAIDVAVLDLNLGGVMAYPVADALLARHIPFVFTTGYEDASIRPRYPAARTCEKPFAFSALAKALADALAA